jgi:hypothetical protein
MPPVAWMPAFAGMTNFHFASTRGDFNHLLRKHQVEIVALLQPQTLHKPVLIQPPDCAVIQNLFGLHVGDSGAVTGGEFHQRSPPLATVQGSLFLIFRTHGSGNFRRRAGNFLVILLLM